uniref:Uncharacterized protein n=1 Tax=Faxonius propinquus nudivirus TaxID=3139431 RepID=A0AAU8GF27_9VIRU
MDEDIYPFTSYVPSLNSPTKFYEFLNRYMMIDNMHKIHINSDNLVLCAIDIRQLKILSIFYLNIDMGTVDNFASASQLQLIVHVYDHKNRMQIFLELIISIDEDKKITHQLFPNSISCGQFYNGNIYHGIIYLHFAYDPSVFLFYLQSQLSADNRLMLLNHILKIPTRFHVVIPENIFIKHVLNMIDFRNINYAKIETAKDFFSAKYLENISWNNSHDIEDYYKWKSANSKEQIWDFYSPQIQIHTFNCYLNSNNHIFMDYSIQENEFFSLVPNVSFANIQSIPIGTPNTYYINKIFHDMDYNYKNKFCNINFQMIDRVYHSIQEIYPSDSLYFEKYRYELTVRMQAYPFQECRYFYIEIVMLFINFVETVNVFITKDPFHFANVIQNGNIKKIKNFIARDEELCILNDNLQFLSIEIYLEELLKKHKIKTKQDWLTIIIKEIDNNGDISLHLKPWIRKLSKSFFLRMHWKAEVGRMKQIINAIAWKTETYLWHVD